MFLVQRLIACLASGAGIVQQTQCSRNINALMENNTYGNRAEEQAANLLESKELEKTRDVEKKD